MPLKETFRKMGNWIRRMQNNSVTAEILLQSVVVARIKNLISDNNQPLRGAKDVPQEFVENLTILQLKWMRGDLSVLPQRGLLPGGPTGWTRDSEWPYKPKPIGFGAGNLVNGQAWLLRAELQRDGAHAPPIAGINGSVGGGVKGVVMGLYDEAGKDYYDDIDQGDVIYYVGTALSDLGGSGRPTNIKDPGCASYRRDRITKSSTGKGPTGATSAMFTSLHTRISVRVFRSFKLAEIVPLRPVTGYRYDGLYIVTGAQLLNRERQIYRFKMERMPGQAPIRQANPPVKIEAGQRKCMREESIQDPNGSEGGAGHVDKRAAKKTRTQ
jgi:hypothetical protein